MPRVADQTLDLTLTRDIFDALRSRACRYRQRQVNRVEDGAVRAQKTTRLKLSEKAGYVGAVAIHFEILHAGPGVAIRDTLLFFWLLRSSGRG